MGNSFFKKKRKQTRKNKVWFWFDNKNWIEKIICELWILKVCCSFKWIINVDVNSEMISFTWGIISLNNRFCFQRFKFFCKYSSLERRKQSERCLIKELNLYQNRHPNQSENLSLQIDQNLKQSFVVVMDHWHPGEEL